MDLAQIVNALKSDAVTFVFLNVFIQQLGVPVPAVPTLLLAGSLVLTPGAIAPILAAAVLASLLADWIWYVAGRLFGYRVLAGLCKFSINPSSCIGQTEARFIRWGLPSLLFAKFIPGFSTVAPPIAGAMRMSLLGFMFAAGLGAGLWAGLVLGMGWLLKDEVADAIYSFDRHAQCAVFVVISVIAIWLGWKVLQRIRFRKLSKIPHISNTELLQAMASENAPLLLDLRGTAIIAQFGMIAGARITDFDSLNDAVGDWPKDRMIVTLCACPEDASSVSAAMQLMNIGYLSVRPLKGGYDAFLAATRLNEMGCRR